MIYKESTTSRANSAEQAEQSMQCTSSCSEQELTREEKRREEKRREEKRSKTLAIRGGAHLGTWASSSWARESLGEPPKRRGWELLSGFLGSCVLLLCGCAGLEGFERAEVQFLAGGGVIFGWRTAACPRLRVFSRGRFG